MFTKIYNLWRQVLPSNSFTSDDYIPYFTDGDCFTLNWAKSISHSTTATACLSTLNDFVTGFGFNQNELEKLQVNRKGQTFFQLHQETSKEFNQNDGFYWLLKYNALGQVTDWEVLPFENCRLGKPDSNGYIGKIYYNPFFGTDQYAGKYKKDTKCYDVFNPSAVSAQYLQQKDKYKGQILFVGTTNAISRFYPINEAYAAVEWMKIEAGVSDYHEDNIENGFLSKFILLMKGDPNAPSSNPDYQNQNNTRPVTVSEEFENEISENFMGAKSASNIWVQWLNLGDEKPELITLPSNGNGEMFITLDNQATKKITVAWKVPGILANIQEGVSLGGDANTIRVAVKLMQQRVIKRQRVLTDSYSKILKLLPKPYIEDVTIVPYNPYPELEVVDDKIWNAMTSEEKRTWIQDNTEIQLLQPEAEPIQQPAQQTQNIRNAVPVSFPQKVRDNVKSTLDYMEKMGKKCGGKSGLEVSNSIVANSSMPLKQLKRIYNYLKAREQYSGSALNEGCEVIQYNLWGGKEMFNFLEGEMTRIEAWLN